MSADTIDSRRFFRLDLPVQCFVIPRNRIPSCDVYATSAVYVTQQRMLLAQQQLEKVKEWLQALQENTDLVKKVYLDIINRLMFFNDVMRSVEQGKEPFKLNDYGRNLALAKAENSHLEAYKENSPKSYAFFKAIENKIKIYLNEIHYMAQHSSSRELGYRHVLYSMPTQADLNLKTLQESRFDKLPLPQFIRSLTEYVNLNLASFAELQKDYVLKRFPTQWPEMTVNLSEGGIRLELPKLMRPGEVVCVAFHCDAHTSVVGLKGTVIGSEAVAQTERYRMRINFDFPGRAEQMVIQKIMNRFEIKQSIDWMLDAG